MSSCPLKSSVVGSCPMATKKPSAGISVVSSVFTLRTRTAGDQSVAQYLLDHGVRDELDLLGRLGTVDHDRRRPEDVAPMHDGDLGGELRQERRLLHRRVAAAHDDDVLVAEEGCVADRAVRDAAALERALGFEPELTRVRARRDDDRLGAIFVVPDPDAERALREVDLRHVVGDELCAEALGLLPEFLHHLRAEHAAGIAGVVLDVARDHQLAAPVDPFDHQRGHVRPGGVEGSGVSGGGPADHDHLAHVCVHVVPLCHVFPSTVLNRLERASVFRLCSV